MAEPVVVSAIGVAVGRSSERNETNETVQEAMRHAAHDAIAEGRTDLAEIKRCILAARDGAI
jgi:hypothetical protein